MAPFHAELDSDDNFLVLNDTLELLRHKDPDLVPNKFNAETFIDVNAEVSVSQAIPSTDEMYRKQYPQQMRLATLRSEENIIENIGDEEYPVEGKPVVPPRNEDLQHALDVLLSASMISAELGEELRKNALSYTKMYDHINVMKKRQTTMQEFFKVF